MNPFPYGFRIVGACTGKRRLIVHADAFVAYAACDPAADVDREAYLSAFTFGDEFKRLLASTDSSRGFDGACFSPWLWFDIDRAADLEAARLDAAKLAGFLAARYRFDDDALLLFFSGSKGFHVGLPASLWNPEPSPTFNANCRSMAEALALAAGVTIDRGVYDRVRAFRAPNSRHPKTGLHKRFLTLDELQGLTVAAIQARASKPAPFDLHEPPPIREQARTDWTGASEAIALSRAVVPSGNGERTALNRATLEFIRNGASEGDRHRLLFSAAANLAEFACPPALAHALLTPGAIDSGLPPGEVNRQIECGLRKGCGEHG